jgi:hypothetical protein
VPTAPLPAPAPPARPAPASPLSAWPPEPPVESFRPAFGKTPRTYTIQPPPSKQSGPGFLIVVVGLAVLMLGYVIASVHPLPQAQPSPSASPSAQPSDPFAAPSPLPTVAGATTRVLLEDAVTCHAVDDSGAPLRPSNTFASKDKVFCSVRAYHLQPGSMLVGVCAQPNGYTVQSRQTSHQSGDYYAVFSFSPPTAGWPDGRHTISLIADGVLESTVSFNVGTASTVLPQGAAMGIVSLTLCRGVTDRTYEPRGSTDTFSPYDPIYASVHVTSKLPADTRLVSTWLYGTISETQVSLTTHGVSERNIYFSRRPTKGGWRLGIHHLELYANGKQVASATYHVRY